jgi:hypothetical protein
MERGMKLRTERFEVHYVAACILSASCMLCLLRVLCFVKRQRSTDWICWHEQARNSGRPPQQGGGRGRRPLTCRGFCQWACREQVSDPAHGPFRWFQASASHAFPQSWHSALIAMLQSLLDGVSTLHQR